MMIWESCKAGVISWFLVLHLMYICTKPSSPASANNPNCLSISTEQRVFVMIGRKCYCWQQLCILCVYNLRESKYNIHFTYTFTSIFSEMTPDHFEYLKALMSKRGLRDKDDPRYDTYRLTERKGIVQEPVPLYLWRGLEVSKYSRQISVNISTIILSILYVCLT